MVDYREQILSLAKEKPLLPGDVAKALNTNMLMASAMLSELSANKKLRVSRLKVGSSPLYFLPEKEALLENYLASLQEKDRQTAEALKNNKVMRDNEQDPLTRFSLRTIADFSRAITIKSNDQEELFWKWYLVSDDDAKKLIEAIVEPQKIAQPLTEKKELSTERTESIPVIAEQKQTVLSEPAENKTKPLVTKAIFATKIQTFFNTNKIKIVEQTQIKKANEYDYVIELPSPVGILTYYCKARNKKKITDADVSNAFVQGQLKKLPVLLITEGELNKQAKELLEKLKGVSFQKI